MVWFLAALLFAGAIAPAQQPDALYAEAVKLQQAGQLEAAVDKYRGFLEGVPNHPGARSNLGAALAALGRYGEAIPEYERALQQMPDHPGIRRNLALAFYKSNRLGPAVGILEPLLKEQPGNLEVALLLADCRFRLGEEAKVIEVLAPLEAKHPDNLAVAYLLGTALIRQGEISKGQLLVDKILRHGDSPEARLMLGAVRMRMAEFDEAVAEFRRALALNPKLPTAHRLIGKCRLETADRAGAAEAFRAELQNNPHDFEANFFLGVALREDRHLDEALPYLERALELRPGDLGVRYQIGSLYLGRKDYEKAEEVLAAIVRESPDFPEAHVALSTAYYRLGRKEDAARHRKISQELMTGGTGAAGHPR